jgi:hypothetical protein
MMNEYPKTTSWHPVQQAEVDEWVQATADAIAKDINARRRRIEEMDDRPDQTWSEEQPNVKFRYVAQGMLEDLIAELVSRV